MNNNPNNRRIIDPSMIGNRRYNTKLVHNIYIPSYTHGYSLGVEFMYNWFVTKFEKDYFKSINIVGKNILDDFKRFNVGDLVTREKPALMINPQPNIEFNREGIDFYPYGPNIVYQHCKPEGSFFKDLDNNIYLGLNMHQIECNFAFRIKLRTRADQLDKAKEIEINFGTTETNFVTLDFHIPYEIILDIAVNAGFKIKDNNIVDPQEFSKYLNKHSEAPILLKFRGINRRFEYFLRMSNVLAYTSSFEQIAVDDGERVGQLDKNFNIDMNNTLRLVAPQFYSLYRPYKVKSNNGNLIDRNNDVMFASDIDSIGSLYDLRVVDIPEMDEHGWMRSAETDYINSETNCTEIDMKPFLDRGDLKIAIDKCMDNFISPSSFLNILVISKDIGFNERLEHIMNWEDYKLVFEKPLPINVVKIVVYLDREIKNTIITEELKFKDTRLEVE